MPAIEPGWEAVFCRCHCLQRRTRFPFAVDPLSVRANRNVVAVLARRHGLDTGVLTNARALELARACTRRVPTHAHAFAWGKRTPFTFRFPQPS
jgi:hypothetical protein